MHVNKVLAHIKPAELAQYRRTLEDKQAATQIMEAAIQKAQKIMSQAIGRQNKWWIDMGKKYNFKPTSSVNIDAQNLTINDIVEDAALAEAARLANSDPDDLDDPDETPQ